MHAYHQEIRTTYSHPARNIIIAREVRPPTHFMGIRHGVQAHVHILKPQHSTLIGSLPVTWESTVFLRVDESR